MRGTMYTKKAIGSLRDIAEGNRANVTRQMIDRLLSEKLIDFDTAQGGWFVTPLGWAAMSQVKP